MSDPSLPCPGLRCPIRPSLAKTGSGWNALACPGLACCLLHCTALPCPDHQNKPQPNTPHGQHLIIFSGTALPCPAQSLSLCLKQVTINTYQCKNKWTSEYNPALNPKYVNIIFKTDAERWKERKQEKEKKRENQETGDRRNNGGCNN